MFVDDKPQGEAQPVRVDLFAAEPWRGVLWRAAELIERNGHATNQRGRDGCKVCCLVAIMVSANWPSAVAEQAETAMHRALGRTAISGWNDETPAAEVITKLREVALAP